MTQQMTRMERRFAALKEEGRAGLITFITAGDPDFNNSVNNLLALSRNGADVIELGMPFTDPMADGPSIQRSSLRALTAGQTMAKTLEMVRKLREEDQDTPLVLMGYYNPIYHMGVEKFLAQASEAGVDGLIVVDLPPEHDDELCLPAKEHGIHFIRLATPTTDSARLPLVLQNTSGFLYYVSSNGVTGAAAPTPERVEKEVARIKEHTEIPVGVGFGIRTPEQAARIAQFAEAVVVGSAFTDCVDKAETPAEATQAITDLVKSLSAAVRSARN